MKLKKSPVDGSSGFSGSAAKISGAVNGIQFLKSHR